MVVLLSPKQWVFFIAQFVFISIFCFVGSTGLWRSQPFAEGAVDGSHWHGGCRCLWNMGWTWGCEDGGKKAVFRKWTTSLSNKLLGLKNLILYFAEMLKMYEVVPHMKHQKNVFVRYTTFGHVRPGLKILRLFCKAPKLVATLCTPLVPWLSRRMRHSLEWRVGLLSVAWLDTDM